jgi:hypothetical protein
VEALKIVLLCIFAALVYGILHDQVTARVCVEYFRIGHPPIFEAESPTLLAFGWGIIATWWVGLLLGVPAALAARAGAMPRYEAGHLVLPVAGLMITMGAVASLAGLTGYILATADAVCLIEPLALRVPYSKHAAFLADLWAHLAAYVVGFVGGIAICGWIWARRRQKAIH